MELVLEGLNPFLLLGIQLLLILKKAIQLTYLFELKNILNLDLEFFPQTLSQRSNSLMFCI